MLDFVKSVFRGFVVFFLWFNLIGCIISGLLVGWGLHGGVGAFLGLIIGVIVGVALNILFGGLVATIICIDNKLDSFDNKYMKMLHSLEAINGTLGKIEHGMSLAIGSNTITNGDIANTQQEPSTPSENLLSPYMTQLREKLLSLCNTEIPSEHISVEPKQNAIYDAIITRIVPLGAFAEYLPGKSGMIASTEIAHERIAKVDDVLKVGDKVRVKVIGFERSGSAKLSIKALL